MYDYLRKGELIMSKEKSLVVDNIQSLEELISSVKEAQRIFSTLSVATESAEASLLKIVANTLSAATNC